MAATRPARDDETQQPCGARCSFRCRAPRMKLRTHIVIQRSLEIVDWREKTVQKTVWG